MLSEVQIHRKIGAGTRFGGGDSQWIVPVKLTKNGTGMTKTVVLLGLGK